MDRNGETRREPFLCDIVGDPAEPMDATNWPPATRDERPDGFVPLALTVNGESHAFSVEPGATLRDVLEEHLCLRDFGRTCDSGSCGGCAVLVNGNQVSSCLTPAAMHDGNHVSTIGAIDDDEPLESLFRMFI